MSIGAINSVVGHQISESTLSGQLVRAAKEGGVSDPRFMEQLQKTAVTERVEGGMGVQGGVISFGGQQVGAPTFEEMLVKGVEVIEGKEKVYQNELRKVLTGESDNIHRAMLAHKESEMYLRVGKVVQRSLVEGWQELMKVQV